jgi:hypothetical protein
MFLLLGIAVLLAPSAVVVLGACLLPKVQPYKSQGMRYYR